MFVETKEAMTRITRSVPEIIMVDMAGEMPLESFMVLLWVERFLGGFLVGIFGSSPPAEGHCEVAREGHEHYCRHHQDQGVFKACGKDA